MAEIGEVRVTLTAVDNVTPTLKRIQRRIWWLQYGQYVAAAVGGFAGGIVGFLIGSFLT